ncbi:alpha/beta fold hydrolase [Roseicitreum antarcticum]|uniref:Pimeloyl-ACP methyl ester carboxylesterase n=1 Tax=Roseicitreum antarcticum TaxID=564137 RepID=A0A1H3E943_9RHOB|nr:alpha/beta hydrolase [Roseicitreum antarcticum]SDX75175.1 Pimeloyl-ACP methyl ester carboxylesterase [Roseicitreum antarcticum]
MTMDQIQLGKHMFNQKLIDAGGIRFHTVSGGTGEPLLLIAGFPQTWYAWRRMMPLLAEKYNVIAIDLPGQGSSDKPANGYDTRTTGDRIHKLMQVMGNNRYSILAHDIGAWVAYPYIARFSDEVRKLVILDANIPGVTLSNTITVGRDNWKAWHFLFHPVSDLPEILITGREREYIEWFFQRKTYNPKATFSQEDIDVYVNAYQQPGNLRGALSYYRAVFDDIEQNKALATQKVKTPILALGGAQGMSPDLFEAMKPLAENLSGGVIDQCGHYMPEEQPDVISQMVLKFLADD